MVALGLVALALGYGGSGAAAMESDFFESVWIVAGRGGLWWLWG